MSRRKNYTDISVLINEIGDEINSTLNNRQAGKYFDDIVLLYSFIENILKWLVCMKLLWLKAERSLHEQEIKAVRNYSKSLSFYEVQQTALSLDVIDWKLYRRIDAVRQERNDIIHQFWLYAHRGNRLVLRKKLEKLAGVSNSLVGVFNGLVKEIGLDDVLELFL